MPPGQGLDAAGPDKGTTSISRSRSDVGGRSVLPELEEGDRIILRYEPANDVYFYTDRDRRGTLFVLGALFAVVVVALGRWRASLR